ncbi:MULTISPECIES: hypothetical protein [Methylotenera]|uniref:hypothetical protein n=1 Tax=Methylotenera TaxID=359407 RepID=UPI00037F0DFF|nr:MULTISPECIES: hypothetical protein [Methylotenera]
MSKILSVLAVGLVAGSLSVGAMAADAAKPADVSASKAPAASVVKKDTGVKASLKKLLPSAKKEAK